MPEHSRHSWCLGLCPISVWLSGCLCLSLDPGFSLSLSLTLSPSFSGTLVWSLSGSDGARLAAVAVELVLQGAALWPVGLKDPHLCVSRKTLPHNMPNPGRGPCASKGHMLEVRASLPSPSRTPRAAPSAMLKKSPSPLGQNHCSCSPMRKQESWAWP